MSFKMTITRSKPDGTQDKVEVENSEPLQSQSELFEFLRPLIQLGDFPYEIQLGEDGPIVTPKETKAVAAPEETKEAAAPEKPEAPKSTPTEPRKTKINPGRIPTGGPIKMRPGTLPLVGSKDTGFTIADKLKGALDTAPGTEKKETNESDFELEERLKRAYDALPSPSTAKDPLVRDENEPAGLVYDEPKTMAEAEKKSSEKERKTGIVEIHCINCGLQTRKTVPVIQKYVRCPSCRTPLYMHPMNPDKRGEPNIYGLSFKANQVWLNAKERFEHRQKLEEEKREREEQEQ